MPALNAFALKWKLAVVMQCNSYCRCCDKQVGRTVHDSQPCS